MFPIPALRRRILAIVCLLVFSIACWSQTVALSGRVKLEGGAGTSPKEASGVVVWLTQLSSAGANLPAGAAARSAVQQHPRLVQTGKHFEPHLLVVPVGTSVEFPNKDPFFHNVFSLFEGRRFDLGLYEAGASRMVRFDKPGISYIFCNIHPEMSAVVIALSTPYYATSNSRGEIVIPDVPPGRYKLNIWFEGSLPEELSAASRELSVSEKDRSFGTIRLTDRGHLLLGHKNKYGKDYDDPTPATPGYSR